MTVAKGLKIPTEREDRIEQLEDRLRWLLDFLEELRDDLEAGEWWETAKEITTEIHETERVLGIEGAFE